MYVYSKLVGLATLAVYWTNSHGKSLDGGLGWVGGFACLSLLLWLESKWRGARKSELSKLSIGLRLLARVSEVTVLISAKVWLIGVAVVLMGGALLDELIYGGIAGLLLGWLGVGIVLGLGRKVGFYSTRLPGQVAEREGRTSDELAAQPTVPAG